MSEQPKGENQSPLQPSGEEPAGEQPMSAEQQQAYNKMMSTLSKMNTKIEKVKSKLQSEQLAEKKNKTDEMTNKLIEAKQNSEIITKENLLTDITETYEHVVIGIYSENAKLKQKVQQMAKIIHEQNNKIYAHTHRQKELLQENQRLKAELLKIKDEKLMLVRGQPTGQVVDRAQQTNATSKKKGLNANPNTSQNQDFDFWSMPQNDYGKKNKNFVQDSSLWVNQKQAHESVFMTEQPVPSSKKKR